LSFWSLIVNPGKPESVDLPELNTLTITGTSIPDLPSDGSNSPIRLIVDGNILNHISLDDNSILKSHKNVLLATLIPGLIENHS
jgi:hypothetical protein